MGYEAKHGRSLHVLRIMVALIFCGVTALYSLIWMTDQWRSEIHPVEIGFNLAHDTMFDEKSGSILVYDVAAGSPAEQAGLLPGDQIIALNGHQLTSYALFDKVWSRSRPGDPVEITARRAGIAEPVTLHAVFRAARIEMPSEGVARASVREILRFFPIFFVIVGFGVLFLRLDDPHAWLLALLFAGFIAVPGYISRGALPDWMQTYTSLYRAIFNSLITALFYIFFALFPERSPLEKRAPWLKWVALALGAMMIWPGLQSADPRLPGLVGNRLGQDRSEYLRQVITYGLLLLGMISLVGNCVSRETSPEARRKSRVLLAGTLVGVLPYVLEHMVIDFSGHRPVFLVDQILGLLVLLYPLSFAYSIVRHRVLEIPALLRRSARYVLVQRGYFVLLFLGAMLAIFLFTKVFARYFADNSQFAMALSAAFGVGLVWASGPLVKRGTDRIDRSFFRRAYDARMVLQDLADKIRSVRDRQELARLLEHHLTEAFHPQSMAIYFAGNDGELLATGPAVPEDLAVLDRNARMLLEVSVRGRSWDVPPEGDEDRPRNFPLASLSPECLVPLLGRDARMTGLLLLGLPLSEEPYSREDKELLDSVAGQSAVALENMGLAEQIANRMEADRRAAHEIEIARDVQSRLFPQVMPALETLDYAGSCLQARQVGGDYYDFLDLRAQHVAFVLADISGKGIAGALLMANLQANLRSRTAAAMEDLPTLLRSANQLFYENTPDDRYATLFFAVYNDVTRELMYANCGHNPPLLFRGDGRVEQLGATATVIGLFSEWDCDTKTVTLQPGDVLVIYTDGVTEANDAKGDEFGDERFREVVQRNLWRGPRDLLTAIQDAVQKFAVGEQFDDLTLVVGRVR